MATSNATQLTAMRTDVDSSITALAASVVSLQAVYTKLLSTPAWKDGASEIAERARIKQQAGHLRYLTNVANAKKRFLTSQIAVVNAGGASIVPVATTSGNLSSTVKVPKRPGAGSSI